MVPAAAAEIPALLPIGGHNGETPVILHGRVTITAAFAAMTLKTFILNEDFFALIDGFLRNSQMIRPLVPQGLLPKS